ncbi:hypothetical protein ACIBVL_03775 [Streptomyces sp. NPDC049687]|uniref:hypothetical protein n=1 Tax=Streptomyces sp. NPDC049687 TaxID=3365596 RepID=UPI0037A35D7F
MVRNIDGRKPTVPISRIRSAATLAGCLIALAGLATAAPASAAPSAPNSAGAAAAAGRSDYCDSYVCGSGTFTFSASRRQLTGAMSVRFPCNTGVTYARIRIVTETASSTGKQYGAWHTTTTCGQYATFSNLTWNQSESIYSWAIQENRSGGGIATGNWLQI